MAIEEKISWEDEFKRAALLVSASLGRPSLRSLPMNESLNLMAMALSMTPQMNLVVEPNLEMYAGKNKERSSLA
jgi:hypothetical protein